MKRPLTPFSARPTMVLLAEPSSLSISLVEILLSKFFRVSVVSTAIEDWEKATSHLKGSLGLDIVLPHNSKLDNPDLVVSVSRAFLKSGHFKNEKKKIETAINFSYKRNAPVFVLLPLESITEEEKRLNDYVAKALAQHKDSVGVIRYGDLLGPRTTYNKHSVLHRLIHDKKERGFDDNKNSIIYPTNTSKLAREVVKDMLSFGAVGKEKALVSEITSAKIFSEKYLGKNLDSLLSLSDKIFFKGSGNIVEIGGISKRLVGESKKWQALTFEESQIRKKKKEENKKKKKKKVFDKKKIGLLLKGVGQKKSALVKSLSKISLSKIKIGDTQLRALYVILVLIISPYILFGVSLLGLSSYVKNIKALDIERAEKSLKFSKSVNEVLLSETSLFSRIPVLSAVVLPIENSGQINNKIVSIGEKYVEIFRSSSKLMSLLFNEEKYNSNEFGHVRLAFKGIYEEMGFVEGELFSESSVAAQMYTSILKKEDLRALRKEALVYEKVFSEIEYLLGFDDELKILLIFQDEKKLRPTGGLITDVAFLIVRNGKFFVSDVFKAKDLDLLNKGQIEPPEAIKNYTGSTTWSFQDANWFSDFATSAEKIEWFVDKQVEESFDGVVSMTHASYLSLMEKLNGKSELDAEVFYDSFEKVGETIRQNNIQENALLLRFMGKLLDEKEILIFVHNERLGEVASDLNWNGEINRLGCLENCYSDFLSVVESDFSEEDVSREIKREMLLKSNIGSKKIERILEITLKNDVKENPDGRGTYSTFIKVVSPADSEFKEVEVLGGKFSNINIVPYVETIKGRAEAGVFVEIPSGESRTIVFRWATRMNLNLDRQGEYSLVVRRQPGVLPYSVDIQQFFESNVSPVFTKEFFLTRNGSYRYNTDLARDFDSRAFW